MITIDLSAIEPMAQVHLKYREKEILLLSYEFLQQLLDCTTPHVK